MDTHTGPGRPRSQASRTAILHAVDDLLIEVGYAAMTMKGIAERAGVGRQTVYRWWTTKAEILWEAVVIDARQELAPHLDAEPMDLEVYLGQVLTFLMASDAGVAYRALIGEAQHDPAVARLIGGEDLLFAAARPLIEAVSPDGTTLPQIDAATAVLVGPALAWALTGRDPTAFARAQVAAACRAILHSTA